MKLHKVLLSEQDIRELIQMYVSSIKKNNMQRQERYKSMIWVRLADLGFDRPHIKKMINDLADVDTEKDVDVIIVAAGMEGALASVVSSMVNVPVIGVPTSVGYGYGEKGIAALASMLQSCSLGLSVVNIDNGIGAGAVAAKIANQNSKK